MSSGFTAINRVAAPASRAERRVPARTISIVIPALNEAVTLRECLPPRLPEEVREVILADGGSADATRDIARELGWTVVHAPRGRAVQMNAAAAVAVGDVLLFLHADTHLPENFASHVAEVLARSGVVAGAFRLKIGAPGAALRVIEALANFRSRLFQMPFGDQAIFVPTAEFRAVGGYPEQPLMEDVELIRRLRRLHPGRRVALAKASVLTSARRWQRLGPLRTTLNNLRCQLAYAAGWPPEKIVRWYYGGRG